MKVLFFRDLLSKDGEKLDIKINPDGTGHLHVPGLRVTEVKSFQHIKKVTRVSSFIDRSVKNASHVYFNMFMKILATARRNRITFGTQMNQHSSRSHALLCITVQGTDLATGSKTTGQSSSSRTLPKGAAVKSLGGSGDLFWPVVFILALNSSSVLQGS